MAKKIPTTIRLPEPLWQKITAMAEETGVSRNAQIILILTAATRLGKKKPQNSQSDTKLV